MRARPGVREGVGVSASSAWSSWSHGGGTSGVSRTDEDERTKDKFIELAAMRFDAPLTRREIRTGIEENKNK